MSISGLRPQVNLEPLVYELRAAARAFADAVTESRLPSVVLTSVSDQRHVRDSSIAHDACESLRQQSAYISEAAGLVKYAEGAVKRRHAVLCNLLYSPIFLLPENVLRIIFTILSMSLYDTYSMRPRQRAVIHEVSQVCHHWRAVTLAQRALWAQVNQSMPPGIYKLWLKRSNLSLLSVELDPVVQNKRLTRFPYSPETDLATEVIANAARVQKLYFRCRTIPSRMPPFKENSFDLPLFALDRTVFPVMEQLHIVNPGTSVQETCMGYYMTRTFLPGLKHIYLRNVRMRPFPRDLPQLQTIYFDTMLLHPEKLIAVVATCPNLKKITLESCHWEFVWDWKGTEVLHTELTDLCFLRTMPLRDFVANVKLPGLRRLVLNNEYDHSDDVVEFLLRKNPTILSLQLWDHEGQANTVPWALKLLAKKEPIQPTDPRARPNLSYLPDLKQLIIWPERNHRPTSQAIDAQGRVSLNKFDEALRAAILARYYIPDDVWPPKQECMAFEHLVVYALNESLTYWSATKVTQLDVEHFGPNQESVIWTWDQGFRWRYGPPPPSFPTSWR